MVTDGHGFLIRNRISLRELGKMTNVRENVIVTPSGARMFTGEIHPHSLPRDANNHVLHLSLARRISSVITVTRLTTAVISFHVPAPTLPARSTAYLFQGLPHA